MVVSISCAVAEITLPIGSNIVSSRIQDEFLVPPSNVHIDDYKGEKVESVTLEIQEKLSVLYLRCTGTQVTWSITPSLPDGLELSQQYMAQISGTPTVALPTTVFTVTAKNEEGEASTTFSLTVTECEYGRFLLPSVWHDGTVFFEITEGKKVLYSSNITAGSHYSICIPQKSYHYRAQCFFINQGHCGFSLKDDKHNMLFSQKIDHNEMYESSFDMIPRLPPQINFKPVFAVRQGRNSHSFIEIKNGCSNVTISPSLDGFSLESSYVINGKSDNPGLTAFTITAVNEKGVTTFSSILGVDMCPDDKELLFFQSFSLSITDTLKMYDSSHSVIFDWRENCETNIDCFTCVNEGDFTIDYRMSCGTKEKKFQNPLYVLHENQVIASFNLYSYEKKQHPFSFRVPVHSESPMKFVSSVSGDWKSSSFKDSNWKQGSSGEWGSFSSSNPSVYFRKKFEISNPQPFSFIHLDLMASDNVTLYLNGQYLTEASSVLNLTRFVLENTNMLKKGKNVLAAEMKAMKPSVTSTIMFDLQLTLASTECLLTSYGGHAVKDPTAQDSAFEDVFNPFKDGEWGVYTFPAVARYTFPFNARHSVTHVKITFDKGSKPSNMRINGLDGDRSIVLFNQTETTPFPVSGYLTLLLDYPGTYSGFEIVFEEPSHRAGVTIRDIRFFSCHPLICKKQRGTGEGTVGTVVYTQCPMFKTGTKQLTCDVVDNKGEWLEDETACLPKYSKKTYSYIDWSVEVTNITAHYIYDVSASIEQVITKNLTVSSDEIDVYLTRDYSTTNTNLLRYDIRFTVECEVGNYVIKHMVPFMSNLTELLRSKIGMKEPNISAMVVSEPVIHNPPTRSDIVILILILILIICVIYIMYLHCVMSRKNKVKSIKKSSFVNHEQQNLLKAAVCIVC